MIQTYAGSCHCRRTRFEVDLDLDHVRVCDCSICRRRGALIHRVPEDALRILTPLDALALYQWHTFTAKDYFCPKCGILPFRRPRARTADEAKQGMEAFQGWGVNVRCLDGVNLESIPIKHVHGSRLD
jgi:hypothetical protein